MEFPLIGYTPTGENYDPRSSGARVTDNPHRVPFDCIMKVELGTEAEGWREVGLRDDDVRIRISTTTDEASVLPQVSNLSFGIRDATLLDPDDDPVGSPDLEPLLYNGDPKQPSVQAVKACQATLDHLRDLPDLDEDGLGDIPSSGPMTRPRVVPSPSWSPWRSSPTPPGAWGRPRGWRSACWRCWRRWRATSPLSAGADPHCSGGSTRSPQPSGSMATTWAAR